VSIGFVISFCARRSPCVPRRRVRVDGELVTDLDTPAPADTRVVVWAE